MAQDAAAEAAPLTALTLTLISVLMWLIFRGLKAGWEATFGAVLEGLADALKYHAWKVHFDFGGPIRRLDRKVVNALTVAALGYEHAIGFWFKEFARLQLWIIDETWKLGRDVFHWASSFETVHMPKWVKATLEASFPPALLWRLVHSQVDAEIVRLLRAVKARAGASTTVIVERVAIPHLAELQWIHRHWKALVAAVAAVGATAAAPALPWVHIFPRIRALERFRTTTRKRLSRLEALTGATAFALLMANVLGLPSPKCLRSGPVGKVARRLCGMSSRAIGDLLGLLADVVILTDLCVAIGLLEDGFALIQPELVGFVEGIEDVLCGGKFDRAPTMPPVELSLPPFSGIVLSLPG